MMVGQFRSLNCDTSPDSESMRRDNSAKEKYDADILIIDDPVSSRYADDAGRMFRLMLRLGTAIGTGLSDTRRRIDRCAGLVCSLLQALITSVYLAEFVVVVATMIPPPDRRFRLDLLDVSAVLFLAHLIYGLVGYWTSCYATSLFKQPDGFYDRALRRNASLGRHAELRRWKSVSFGVLLVSCALVFLNVCRVISTVSGQSQFNFRWGNAYHWLGLSYEKQMILRMASSMTVTVHLSYCSSYYVHLCEFVRMHTRIYCAKLGSEAGENMHPELIDRYHAEYIRLKQLIDWLNVAFQISCFFTVVVFTLDLCMTLYFVTRDEFKWASFLHISFSLLGLTVTFLCATVPAMMLANEFRRPLSLLHSWLEKYQLTNRKTDHYQDIWLSYMAFTKTLTSQCPGITLASLCNLDYQLFATVASAVVTYFLVILQFGNTDYDAHSLKRLLSESHHLCQAIFLANETLRSD